MKTNKIFENESKYTYKKHHTRKSNITYVKSENPNQNYVSIYGDILK